MSIALYDKLPPQNIEAEQSVLGACLICGEIISEIASIIDSDDFYRLAHRTIYEAALNLHQKGEPVDIITVSNELANGGKLEEAGGPSYLTTLINVVPTAANADNYAHIVSEKATLRRLIYAGTAITSLGYGEDGDTQEILENAKKMVMDIVLHRSDDSMTPLRDGVRRVMAEIDTCLERGTGLFSGKYVTTGFKNVDDLIGGYIPGNLHILCARPGMGKTTFMLENTLALSQTRPVALFSFEDPEIFVVTKSLALESLVESRDIQRGPITPAIHRDLVEAANKLYNKRLYYCDRSCTVSDMRRKSRAILSAEGDLGAIFIDRVEFIRDNARGGETRNNQLTRLSADVVDMAREFAVPVILIVQLSRDVEKRSDKRPIKSDLRDCGAFEQDARLIMSLYRDEYYNKRSDDKGIAEVGIIKNNHGPEGVRKLKWWGSIPRYDDAEFRYDDPDEPPKTKRRKQAERGCYDDDN